MRVPNLPGGRLHRLDRYRHVSGLPSRQARVTCELGGGFEISGAGRDCGFTIDRTKLDSEPMSENDADLPDSSVNEEKKSGPPPGVTDVGRLTPTQHSNDEINAPDARADDFAALFAASETAAGGLGVAVGELISGRVVAIGRTTAFVTVGAKGEAEIDLAEFRDPITGALTLAVGDRIEGTVVDDGRTSGSIVLKQTLGRGAHLPAELEQALQHGIAVEGVVTGENKGGFEVQIGGARAFCPGSQIDLRRGERRPAAQYIGQRLRFRVTRIEAGGRNVVVSRRQLLEQEASEHAAETWSRLELGAVVSGTVTSVRDFGAFVDVGGVEALIHITELGYGRVTHPSDVLSEGQVVEAQVIKLEVPAEGARGQVALSLKALARDPWETVAEKFPVGTTVRGTVRRLEAFGAFVEIAPGCDGLVHVSKLALDRRISHPRQVVSPGDEVEVTVLAVDPTQRRLSLSMIESVRAAQEAAQTRDRADEQAMLAKENTARSLGTFADLLAGSKNKRR
jgi:small subunit ribosomal protein S1